MTISADALRELHRIHRQLSDLRDRLTRGPKQVQAAEGSVRKMELDLEQAKETLQKARMNVDEKQLQLKTRESRIEDLNSKLNTAASNREYQALKEQIAADRQANSVLEDEILEGLEKIDETSAQSGVAEENLKRSQAEHAKVKDRVDSQHTKLESEMERVLGELATAEANLPSDFKVEYKRISKARGEAALAEVEGEVCGGCYQTLTPQIMNELYMHKPVFCKSCGCLMYLAEGRVPNQ